MSIFSFYYSILIIGPIIVFMLDFTIMSKQYVFTFQRTSNNWLKELHKNIIT